MIPATTEIHVQRVANPTWVMEHHQTPVRVLEGQSGLPPCSLYNNQWELWNLIMHTRCSLPCPIWLLGTKAQITKGFSEGKGQKKKKLNSAPQLFCFCTGKVFPYVQFQCFGLIFVPWKGLVDSLRKDKKWLSPSRYYNIRVPRGFFITTWMRQWMPA